MTDAPPVSLLAVNAILDRVEPLVREAAGVAANEDPECLHRMRVASRRLRMALRLLGTRAGISSPKAFQKRVRKVTRVLGAARDLDVQLIWIREFAETCAAREKRGVLRIALRLAQERERLQPGVARIASDICEDPVFKRTVDELRRARIDAEMAGVDTTARDMEHATRVIGLQLDCVLQHAASLLSPDAADAQHRMRIEVKHLRYAMEIFGPLYGEALDEYIALAKKLQSMLGDLHDADVWTAQIPAMEEAERKRTTHYFGTPRPFTRLASGYRAVREDRCRSRKSSFEGISKIWQDAEKTKQWINLRQALLCSYKEKIDGQDALCQG